VNEGEPEGDEYPELCDQRCGSKLIKDKTIHECILHRGHTSMVAQHVCNCGTVWIDVDLQ